MGDAHRGPSRLSLHASVMLKQLPTALSYPGLFSVLPDRPLLPNNTPRETLSCGPPGPLPTLPPANPTHRGYPHTPTFHAPLMLPTHPMPRSLAVRHTHASAALCTAQSLTEPHPNLADSCGAVCAAARRSWSLLPVISFSVPLVFPTAQELACVSFRPVVAPTLHALRRDTGEGYDDR